MYRFPVYYYILLVIISLSAQENSIEELTKKYTSFEYREVIQTADKMIQSGIFSSEELIKIYELKGMALYSLGDETYSRITFEELLKLAPNYSMDTNRISPKIISFFNEIKVAHQNEVDQQRPILDSLRIVRQEMITEQNNYKIAVVKNLLLPGWGHLDMSNKTKGVIYTVLEVAGIVSSIIYIQKANDARSAYLNETDKLLISTKYDEYNSAYKTRNILLTITAAIWATSQIDLLFFTDITATSSVKNTFSKFTPPQDLQISFSLPLN